jgi:hypothetical protein
MVIKDLSILENYENKSAIMVDQMVSFTFSKSAFHLS